MSDIYVARLVPLRKHVPVVDRDEGAIHEYFDEYAFALARKHPGRVKFLIEHDPGRVAGRFHGIVASGSWLVGGFTLDDNEYGAYAAERLKHGSPISIGFDPELSPELGHSGTIHRQVAKLNEASLVDRAAYKGAVVTQILKPSPVVERTSDRSAAGEVIIHAPGTRLVRPGVGRVLGVR